MCITADTLTQCEWLYKLGNPLHNVHNYFIIGQHFIYGDKSLQMCKATPRRGSLWSAINAPKMATTQYETTTITTCCKYKLKLMNN